MKNELIAKLKATLINASDGAAEVLMSHFGNLKEIAYKGEVNLVTEADKNAEKAAIEIIRTDFPDHAILAEEGGGAATESAEFRWIIDPLDGTTNYAHGLPIFSVSIGLEHAGRIIMGRVKAPAIGETYFAEHGHGATLNGRAIHVSHVATIRKALAATGFGYDRHEQTEHYVAYLQEFLRDSQDIRRGGCASLDMCWVACGRYDLFFEENLHPWDTAAGLLILEEAGGKLTDYQGGEYQITAPSIAATNRILHDQTLSILAQVRQK